MELKTVEFWGMYTRPQTGSGYSGDIAVYCVGGVRIADTPGGLVDEEEDTFEGMLAAYGVITADG